jgi:hypothetical protein
MADYHSLLTRAVSNLPGEGSPATRQAIYDRARMALVTQLRSLRPPLPENDIAREESALDAAIARIEERLASKDAAGSVQPAAPEAPAGVTPAPKPVPPSVPPAQAPRSGSTPVSATPPGQPAPKSPLPSVPHQSGTPERSAPVSTAPAPKPAPPVPPGQRAPKPAPATPPVPVPPSAPGPGQRPPSAPAPGAAAPTRPAPFKGDRPAPASAAAVNPPQARGPGVTPGAMPVNPSRPPGGSKPLPVPPMSVVGKTAVSSSTPAADLAKVVASAKAVAIGDSSAPPIVAKRLDDLAQLEDAPEVPGEVDRAKITRQDGEGLRPTAPTAIPGRPTSWLWFAFAVLLGLGGVIGIANVLMKQRPQDLAVNPPAEMKEPVTPQTSAKIGERVQSAPANPAAPPAGAIGDAQGNHPGAPGATAPTGPAAEPQTPAAATVPVAGRAAMLVAAPDNPQKAVYNVGSTVWSTIPPAPGQPATVAVKAEADIPDLKMHATMTLRKNTDPTLQATHTIDLKFAFADGAPITGFKDVGLPQMRKEGSTASEALTSVKVKISDVYFLIALAKGEQDIARNLDLMQTRDWFDFPLLLNDGRIAKMVFQKSQDGEAMLAKAFEAWK